VGSSSSQTIYIHDGRCHVRVRRVTGNEWPLYACLKKLFTFSVGVGFDTKGSAVAAHKNITVLQPSDKNGKLCVVPDSREGMYLNFTWHITLRLTTYWQAG
jgi:hypothetical protein